LKEEKKIIDMKTIILRYKNSCYNGARKTLKVKCSAGKQTLLKIPASGFVPVENK